MDLVELLRKRHPDYDGPHGRRWWKLARDAATGDGGFRFAVEYASTDSIAQGDWLNPAWQPTIPPGSYLARFDRENPRQFVGRLRTAHYRNHIGRALRTYAGNLWRRPPARKSENAAVVAWWENTDSDGTKVLPWLQRGAHLAHLHGWAAAYFDRDPVEGVASLATARTVARWLQPEEVADWELDGDGELVWVKLVTALCRRDPFTGARVEVEEYTIWTRTAYRRVVLVEDAASGKPRVETDTGIVAHALGAVPLAVLYWEPRADLRALYNGSHMDAAISAAVELFNVSSEARHVERGTAFPVLYVQTADQTTVNNLKIGVHNGIVIELDAKIPPGMFGPPPELSTHFAARRKELREDIFHAVSLDPPQADAQPPESGTARAYRFLGQRAALGAAAQQLARFEFECVDRVARWDAAATPGAVDAAALAARAVTSVTYPEDFDVQDVADVLDTHDPVLAQPERYAPVTVRTARLAVGRAIDPQPTAENERALREQVEMRYLFEVAQYSRRFDVTTLDKAVDPPKADLNAFNTPWMRGNEIRATVGLGPIEGGETVPALQAPKPDPAASGDTRPGATTPGANGGASMSAAGAP